jgi:hypothetical protein
MDESGRSDDELITAARDDPSAFGLIYRRHSEAVLRYLLYSAARVSSLPS